MSSCLLLLHWPDICAGSSLGDPAPSPALILQALRRQLSLRHPAHSAYICGVGADREAARLSASWGFACLPDPLQPTLALSLAREHPEAERVLLAMRRTRGQSLAPTLQALGRHVELWSSDPAALPAAALPIAAPERELAEVLRLRTACPVGLFVDGRHLQAALPLLPQPADPQTILARLVSSAALVGSVVTARVYELEDQPSPLELAGWTPAWPHERLPGAREDLRADLWELLDSAHAPQTWIVVSNAAWLPDFMQAAQARRFRVLWWSASEAHAPPLVRAEADGWSLLSAVLAPATAPTLGAEEPARAATIREERPLAVAGAAPATDTLDGPVRGDSSVLQEPVVPGPRLGPWIRLVYHTECVLRRHQWSRIAFRKLGGMLAELEEFGPTPANALLWLNRAKAEGMLGVEQEAHRADPALRVTTCRPNPEHPISRAAVDVPDRVLRLLCQMLHKMPWVSFKLLRSVLLREQWLGGAPYELDETGVDEWLNFLIRDGAITMTKEPNAENPDYPVTALRINEEHPLSRTVVAEAIQDSRLAAERAILAVDHFLRRNRKPWMAMSALRRSLESIGREELHEVLQGLQKLGALVTESYPNPQKEHFTTGCRLNSHDPVVVDALSTRDTILRVTQFMQRHRNWISLSQVDEELSRHSHAASSATHRLAWFALLRDEGLLELDREGVLSGEEWGSVQCRLNVSDAVVRAIVAEQTEPSAGRLLPAALRDERPEVSVARSCITETVSPASGAAY